LRLVVVSPFVDRQHGTERALAESLERLAHDYGCEVHLYSQRVGDLTLREPEAKGVSKSGGIIWHKVPRDPGPHLVQFLAWIFFNGMLRWFDSNFRGLRFDLVLSPGINCFHADVVIVHALFHRLQELSREQGNASQAESGIFRGLHRRFYYGLLTRLERHIYADPRVTLAAVSQRTAGFLTQYFRRQDVRVIPNGMDTAQFSPAARLARRAEARGRRRFRDDDFVLLLIGNDWRVKGLTTILETMASLPDLSLQLITAGSDAPEFFRERARQLGVVERCRWELPRRDVLDLYAAADVYVSPSQEDSFGLPVAEAMACGLPVITSVFAGVSEFIRDGAEGYVLRDARDAKSLAHLLRRLHEDPALRRKVGQAATARAAEWTWGKNAEALWQLLGEATARKKESHTSKRNP